MKYSFREQLREDYSKKMLELQSNLDIQQCLKMDLHCHDKNSDVPDELWGRILGLPETWLKTSQLMKVLKHNGSTAYTITNHNNARSCWKLKEKGVDVLSGAEFTCHMEEHQAAIHVLAYGFTPEQESKLNLYRRNIYKFCSYTLEQNIPTVLPHPTYLYFKEKKHNLVVMEKLAILFQRFEVLNGQRDIWQNMLTLSWLEGLREEDLKILEKRHGLRSADFCSEPYQKSFTGGTDDHMGIFAGSCGTLIQVDRLSERMDREPLSELALEGLRSGKIAPYGHLGHVNEKLNTAFLDYFSQVTMNMKDPGVTRIMLHKGDVRSKLFCLAIANGIFELRRHRHTMSFMKLVHEAMRGKTPSRFKKFFVSKKYRPIFDRVVALSKSMQKGPEEQITALRDFLDHLYLDLQDMAISGIKKKFSRRDGGFEFFEQDWSDIVNRLELPAHLRVLAGGGSKNDDFSNPSMGQVLDQCSFPLLGAGFLAASTYTSTRVMFNARGLLDELSASTQTYQHPKKVLWLTDTLFDKNGVSMFLQELLRVVRAQDMPIDVLTCGEEARTEDHLHVLKETCRFKFSRYGEQDIRIPNLMDVQKIFYEGAYDRIVCSTEVMGMLGIYLKTSFSVPCYFYMHTDWMDFCKRSLHLEDAALSRVRRGLRFYYNRCDGVFVLNEDHRQWLCGSDMGLPEEKVYKTSHWVGESFDQPECDDLRSHHSANNIEGSDAENSTAKPVMKLLYVGRLSEEKGVYDLPEIMKHVSNMGIPAELTIIGDGPSLAVLSQELPSAQLIPWLPQSELAAHYRGADLLLFPSRFDTFGCVVLEAMACGCPVLAYNCKGPKDIIEHGRDGYLVNSVEEAVSMIKIHGQKQRQDAMRQSAMLRAKEYSATEVMIRLLMDVGIPSPQGIKCDEPGFMG